MSDRLADRLEAARQRAEAARLAKPEVAPVVVDLRADEGHGCRHSPPGMRDRESDARDSRGEQWRSIFYRKMANLPS